MLALLRSDVQDLTHTYNHARLGEEVTGCRPAGGGDCVVASDSSIDAGLRCRADALLNGRVSAWAAC